MSTATLPQADGRGARLARRAMAVLFMAVSVAGSVGRARAVPTASHLRDHAYSIAGFGFISAAAFYHSTFAGLLVLGLSFFIYEWKVSE
jgi:hypothetical protein